MTDATTFKTADQIRLEAEAEYIAANPKPEPPTPAEAQRPSVIRVGDAHAWLEVTTESHGWGDRAGKVKAKFFIVHRGSNGQDQRIEGELTNEAITGFVHELAYLSTAMQNKQTYLDDTAEYSKRLQVWERARDEFARKTAAEWEKKQKSN
jgi:hypothetical protein